MALRWYTAVVDAHDPAALARWWADALGWVIAFESAEEVVLVPPHAGPEFLATLTWEQVPPGLVFVAAGGVKSGKNRLHLDLAPHSTDDRAAEIQRLLDAGAHRLDVGQPADASWDVLADPEGNEFCVLSARSS